MVDLKKDQLSLFGRPGRRPPPTLEPVAEPEVEPPVEVVPPDGVVEGEPESVEQEPIEASSEPPADVGVEQALPESIETSPTEEPAAGPERSETTESSQQEAGEHGAGAGKPREQYLFPPQGRQRLDLPFSRRMSDLARRLQLLERDAKGHLNLTLPQSHAIHALMEAGSLRMQELAGTLGLAQSTVTRLVAPLKRMGLLDRRPDRADGRATRAFLTPRGAAVVDQLEKADRELYEEVLGRLPDTRRAEVVAAVELLHEGVLDLIHERSQQLLLDDATQ